MTVRTPSESDVGEADLAPDRPACPSRRTFVALESLVAIGGLVGAIQLFTGTFAPPVTDLEPLGLSSWRLPALWLVGTTAVPSATAAVLALRGARSAPAAVLVAAATLAVELVVQVPFVGPNPMQAVFGSLAVGLTALALRARRLGWR